MPPPPTHPPHPTPPPPTYLTPPPQTHTPCCLQDWGSELFEALKQAGGVGYSNYAVGYNNVKVPEATKRGIPVGNTPGACSSVCGVI
jgi:hypothetical protein